MAPTRIYIDRNAIEYNVRKGRPVKRPIVVRWPDGTRTWGKTARINGPCTIVHGVKDTGLNAHVWIETEAEVILEGEYAET